MAQPKEKKVVKHPVEIKGLDAIELAHQISQMDYEALQIFLQKLSEDLAKDGLKDQKRGRPQLAASLFATAGALSLAYPHMKRAWEVSCSHMKGLPYKK